jgi:hypothetical protein
MGVKISELPGAAIPLDSTNLIEVAQSGTSVKVEFSEIQDFVLGYIGSFDGTSMIVAGQIDSDKMNTDYIESDDDMYIVAGNSGNEGLYIPRHSARGNLENILAQYGHALAQVDLGGVYSIVDFIAERRSFNSNMYGQYIYVENQDTSGTGKIIGTGAIAEIKSGVTSFDEMYGADHYTQSDASVTADLFVGTKTGAIQTGNNSTISEIKGIDSYISLGSPMVDCTLTTAIGVDVRLLTSGSGEVNITDGYGVKVNSPGFNSTGVTTNLYGLYVGDQTAGGFTNTWNIYSAGATAKNRIEGQLRVDGQITFNTSIVSDSTDAHIIIAGDIYCDDLYTSGGSIYVGNAKISENASGGFTIGRGTQYGSTAKLHVGVEDTEHGILNLYSDPVAGGELYIYTGGYYDDTIEYYLFSTASADIRFGPSTNTAAMNYSANNNIWNFTATGGIGVGVDDVQEGVINIYGGGNNEPGGSLKIYNAADQDGTINYYEFKCPTGSSNLLIGPDTNPDALKYNANSDQWEFDVSLVSDSTDAHIVIAGDIYCDDLYTSGSSIYVGNSSIKEVGGDLTLTSTGTNSIILSPGGNTFLSTSFDGEAVSSSLTGNLSIAGQISTTGTNQIVASGSIISQSGVVDSGVSDNTPGQFRAYGGGNGEAGGEVRVYNPADQDGSINYYTIQSKAGDAHLYIGPNGDDDALVYNSSSYWEFRQGTVYFGESDAEQGYITLYSLPTGNASGGQIEMVVAPDYDDAVDSYLMGPDQENFIIGPDIAAGSITYRSTANTWEFTEGKLLVGKNDNTVQGFLTIGSSSAGGGQISIQVDEDEDDTIGSYLIGSSSDDLTIGPITDTDALKYDGGNNQWVMSASGGVSVTNNLTVNGVLRFNDSIVSDSTDAHIVIAGDIYCDELYTSAGSVTIGSTKLSEASGGGLEIGGTSISSGSITDDGTLNIVPADTVQISTTAASTSILIIGDNDDSEGSLRLYPKAALGGNILLYVPNSFDDVIAYYKIEATEDDLAIGPDTDSDALKYFGELDQWRFSSSGGVDINILTVAGSDIEITEISNEASPASDSTSVLVTEAGIVSYVENVKTLSGQEEMPTDATSVVVTVTPARPDTNYYPVCTIENTTDITPSFFNFIITNKTTTNFTVEFDAPFPTGNYKLNWKV